MKIIINMENTNSEGTIYMVKGPSEKIYYKIELRKSSCGCNWEVYKRIQKKNNGSVKRQCNVQKQKGDDILNL
jgi:hypothetical protein